MKPAFMLFIAFGGPMLFSILPATAQDEASGPSRQTSPATFNDFVDPTGTYILKGSVAKNRVMGHSGEIRVKLLDPGRVAVSFYINRGYPDYEAGSFTDTLPYTTNQARWTPSEDPGYTVVFSFKPRAAETIQLFSGNEARSDFADGVMVSAVFLKYSDAAPIIQDLSARRANL
jgi:hypothetical protein